MALNLSENNFVPIPDVVGAYRKKQFGREFSNREFVQSKWVRHEQALEKVLEGDYDLIMPITAEFIPSLDCCCRCPTCPYKPWKKEVGVWEDKTYHPAWNMDYASMVSYLEKLKESGVKAIIFTGGGEPFYNPHTVEGIEYACKLDFGVGIYTNGILLDKEKISRVFEAKPTFFRISLNAGNSESHSKIHGYDIKERYFEKVLENIGLAAQKRKEQGFKTSFQISVIVNPINIEELEQIAYVLKDINEQAGGGIGNLNVRPTVEYHGGKQFPEEIFKKAEEVLETKVRRIMDDSGIELYNLTYKFENVMKPRTHKKCKASSLFVELGPDGTLFLCCEKLGYPEYAIGNLKEQTLEKIWKSEERKKTIEMVNLEKCKNCPPSCKPYPYQDIFDQIEIWCRQRANELVINWIEDLKRIELKEYNFL